MLKIDRKISYALYVLNYFAHREAGHKASAREICDIHNAPFDATSRAMQQMTQRGWLESVRGVGGGYSLRADLDEISFLELSETIVGPHAPGKCLRAKLVECDSAAICNVLDPAAKLSQKVTQLFSQVRISELIDSREDLQCDDSNLVTLEI